nr:radical SAM protein [Desulfobacula sp.]
MGISVNNWDNEFYFYIDVVGGCNLKCPSCPRGNSRNIHRAKGVMEPVLLERIMEKALSECKVSSVGLFNWTEPLLHPRLSELVQVVKSYGISCSISTNLNVKKSFIDLLRSNLDTIYISTSGFFQSVYGLTHKGGNIELVKNNMKKLAEAKVKYDSTTAITVLFHQYKSNQQDEYMMRNYSESLGFEFCKYPARMLPLEKVLAYNNNDPDEPQLTSNDLAIMNLLIQPLDEAMELARKNREQPCTLLTKQFTLNVLGDVELCCGIFDSKKYTISNFLDMPMNQIQALRSSHPMCKKCTAQGGHVYYGL